MPIIKRKKVGGGVKKVELGSGGHRRIGECATGLADKSFELLSALSLLLPLETSGPEVRESRLRKHTGL